MAKSASLITMKAVAAMERYYCNEKTKCLPRGSYKAIAKELDIDERVVSKNARLHVGIAHVHSTYDSEFKVSTRCWICGVSCKK